MFRIVPGCSMFLVLSTAKKTHLIFWIPIRTSLFHLALISIERFVAIKYTFRYVTIVTEFRLKMAVISSWVIACCSAILQSLFEEFKSIIRVVGFMLVKK